MTTPVQVTVHRLAPELSREEWCQVLTRLDLRACELLKQEGESRVVSTTILERAVVIKLHRRRGVVPGLRSWLGLSRDDRQWRGAELLREAGIPTAEPLALVTRSTPGSPPEGLLVLERLSGPTLLEVLSKGGLTVQQEHALAREAGRVVGRVALAGLSNRDAKPSNWIVTSTDPRHPGLALIDTAGVRRGSEPSRMLASMIIEAIGTGCAPRRSLAMRCLRASVEIARPIDAPSGWTRDAIATAWSSVAEIVQSHGDPTPRINPLGPPRFGA